MKTILNVGCGFSRLPESFLKEGWKEIRLDIDPGVNPDVISDITNMRLITNNSVEIVYSAHNLEHLYEYQVPLALNEFYRVLKPGGKVYITVPDLQEVALAVAEGRLEEKLYDSQVGPISAIDVLYGHRPSIVKGNTAMVHKTGFIKKTLWNKLVSAGFKMEYINEGNYALWAIASKEE